MAITTNMNLDLPEVGTSTVNSAAADLVTAFEDVDSHDHSSGSGVKVTPAGININASLDMNDSSLLAAHLVEMTELPSAVTGASNANRLQSVNGELYFTDGTGVAVAVTANGGLDITVSGGFTGDYGSTTAEATYVSATKAFKFMQDGNNNQAAVVDAGDIKLRTTTAGASNYVTIKSPILSSSYTITLPTAVPASTSLMLMDNAGVVSTSRTPSITSLATTAAVTVGTTLGVTGVSTLGVVNATSVNGVDPSSLAARFITAGADEIDGDQLDIDFTPVYYTPATTPAEASSLDHLSAHLYGIDDALNTIAGGGGTDHGTLAGLSDDDHTQYHNDTRGDARYHTQALHINSSAGAGDAGKPIKLDAAGHIDASMLNDADIDHGTVGGLGDDDHTQYVLVTGARSMTGGLTIAGALAGATTGTFSSTVTASTFNGVDPSALASRFITGGADQIDGDKLDIDWTPSNYTPTISPSEANNVNNLTAHLAGVDATLASIVTDHGALSGKGDDDHTQYHNDTRGDARYYTQSAHINTSAGAGDSGKPVKLDSGGKVDASMINDGDIDHGSIAGLSGDDHSQYHNDTRGDARYHPQSVFLTASAGAGSSGKPIELDAGGKVDASMINDADIDHGTVGGLGDDDHTQYVLANGTRSVTGTLACAAGTYSSTLTATGLITANGGVTLGTGDDLTIVGTGEIKHGDRELSIAGPLVAAGIPINLPIPLLVGDRLKSISWAALGADTSTKTIALYQVTLSTGSTSSNETDTFATNTHATGTLTVSPEVTVTNDRVYFVTLINGHADDRLYGIVVTYDHP